MFLQINKPDKGDPFFNTAACGGVSTCIVIKNCAEGLNTIPNCVAGAVGAYEKAACEDISKPTFNHLPYPPNAENIYAYAHNKGLPVSDTPEVGAIVVWQKGATLNGSDGAGHVAFIYKVDESGNIYTSESEYGGRAWVNRSYTKASGYFYGNGYKLLGFVLQPKAKKTESKQTEQKQAETKQPEQKDDTPNITIKRGMKGDAVKWLQERLNAAKDKNGGTYLRKTEIDGDFGTITFGALLAFQFDNELEMDGVCGAKTKAKL